MKTILGLLFVLISFASFAQTGDTLRVKAPKAEGKYIETSGKIPIVEGECRNGYKVGTWNYYDRSGSLEKEEKFSDEGYLLRSRAYNKSTERWEELNFQKGKPHGAYRQSINKILIPGTIATIEGWYAEGKMDSTWSYYRSEGKWKTEKWKKGGLLEVRTYYIDDKLFDVVEYNESGRMVKQTYYDKSGNTLAMLDEAAIHDTISEMIFQYAEEPATFDGGEQALLKFIQNNTHYPDKAKDENRQGKVFVSFVVNRYGKVENVQVIKAPPKGEDFAAEAVRVVKMMPPWKAAKMAGRRVSLNVAQPINFSLK
jgi:TonB family protein